MRDLPTRERLDAMKATADQKKLTAQLIGDLENKTEEFLPDNYRTHGSEYETRIPLIILNAGKLPQASYFNYNKDLLAWLFDKDYQAVLTGFK